MRDVIRPAPPQNTLGNTPLDCMHHQTSPLDCMHHQTSAPPQNTLGNTPLHESAVENRVAGVHLFVSKVR
jgi:ankyrin repeat protein